MLVSNFVGMTQNLVMPTKFILERSETGIQEIGVEDWVLGDLKRRGIFLATLDMTSVSTSELGKEDCKIY